MRRTIAIVFLITYLSTTTELGEVFKLPVVWQHFQEHRAANPDLSFIAFLKMHYFNGDPKDADYQRDMQLPFKTHAHIFTGFSVAVPPVTFTVTAAPVQQASNHVLPVNDRKKSSIFTAAIWQPPKVV